MPDSAVLFLSEFQQFWMYTEGEHAWADCMAPGVELPVKLSGRQWDIFPIDTAWLGEP